MAQRERIRLNIRYWQGKSFALYPIICILFLGLTYTVHAQSQTGNRAEWFVNDRFGMFVHWGIYSGAEGIWKGEKLRNDNDYAEWIQYRNSIDKQEYLTLLKRFDWDNIDPEKWVILAKKAGMKYITLTAKHHDGFALWNSKASNYNIWNYSAPNRDIVKEMAAACKKHGLKMGLYYSHWIDWEHSYGWNHDKELTGLSSADYDKYWQEKVIPQVQELLTDYGDIGMFWFDMWINHSESVVTKSQLQQLKSMIRKLQPQCLVNSRLGLSLEEDPDVDFRTLGDNQLGTEKLDYPWQTPSTVAHSWGFNSYEDSFKSTTSLLKALIGNVSLNGNYMLNIGPRADSEVPYEISSRLVEMGNWLGVNGESIYGSEAFDLSADQHDWGKITSKKSESGTYKIYAQVYNWPLNKSLTITGIRESPTQIYLLADKGKSSIKFKHNKVLTHLSLPFLAPDSYVSTVVLEYAHKPEIEKGLTARLVSGGYVLKPNEAISAIGKALTVKSERGGTVPGHESIKSKQTYEWKIYVDKPVKFYVDASYSSQEKANGGTLKFKVGDEKLEHVIKPTGKTIGEPNQNWVVDNFKSNRIGEVSFDKPGYYTLQAEFKMEKGKEINWNWIWLEER